MYRVLTVAREYGSGGASIARRISQSLGWELLDRDLILKVACANHLQSDLVGQYDERVDSWLHRVSRRSLWRGAFEGVAAVAQEDFFDAETVADAERQIIEAAHERGNCVIVGRGAQCILQDRADAFHVFVYAPWTDRVRRIRERLPDENDVEELIHLTDRQRAGYIRLHFEHDWADRHLYHMLISSEPGEDVVASLITGAMGLGK